MASCIATIAPQTLDDQPGYVLLGTLGGLAYVHLAPGLRPDWTAQATLVYDPAPAPFVWAEFATAHPDLAASLMPHQWAGE